MQDNFCIALIHNMVPDDDGKLCTICCLVFEHDVLEGFQRSSRPAIMTPSDSLYAAITQYVATSLDPV